MNTISDALKLVFIFVAAGLTGQWLTHRLVKIEVLEVHQGTAEAMMGVVGTLFSVLLGFMVAGAMDKYHEAQMHCIMEASNLASAFRVARGLSDIDRPRIRELCREYANDVIENEWPRMEHGEKINHGWESYQKLWEASLATVPENDRQNNLHQSLMNCIQSLGENRRARILLAQQKVHIALWTVLGFGALITLSLSFIFASQFPRIQGFMTSLVATALSLNIWLLAAYSQPFSGELKVKPDMFHLVKEMILTVPDTPSRYLHDNPPDKK